MKHLIDTGDEGEVLAVLPSGTWQPGEEFKIHKPVEHPDCQECLDYLARIPYFSGFHQVSLMETCCGGQEPLGHMSGQWCAKTARGDWAYVNVHVRPGDNKVEKMEEGRNKLLEILNRILPA